jgi:hypothetical protein
MRSVHCIALCAIVVSAVGAPRPASAQTATTPSCRSGDPVVWVNTSTHVYHLQGDPYYGKTKSGNYACESAAEASGAHASGAKTKSAAAVGGSASVPSAMASPTMSKKKKHHVAGASPAPVAT